MRFHSALQLSWLVDDCAQDVSSSVVVDVRSVVVVTFALTYPGSDDTELAVALKSSTAKMGSSVVVASNSCK